MTDEELNVKFEDLKADIADKFAEKLDILEQRLREMGFDPTPTEPETEPEPPAPAPGKPPITDAFVEFFKS